MTVELCSIIQGQLNDSLIVRSFNRSDCSSPSVATAIKVSLDVRADKIIKLESVAISKAVVVSDL